MVGLSFVLWAVSLGALSSWFTILLVRGISSRSHMEPANVFRMGSILDFAIEVFPTPGGPARHKIGPLRSFLSFLMARYSIILP